MLSYPKMIQDAAKRVAEAEKIKVENEILKRAVRATDEDMVRYRELATLALKVAYPYQFLAACDALTRQPLFVPCPCWWCKLKRWVKRLAGVKVL